MQVSIKKREVPPYLQASDFFLALQDNDEDILVPTDCMKMDDTVSSNEELYSLLLTLRFWVAGYVCDSILAFTLSRPFETYEDILSQFYQDLPELHHIKAFTVSDTPMKDAINSGVIDFVKYFLKQDVPWPNRSCAVAAAAGCTSILKLAIESGCNVSTYSAAVAATKGHLDCLKVLRENGVEWDTDITSFAAYSGRLGCLQYAHEQGCPWLCNEKEPKEDSDDGYSYVDTTCKTCWGENNVCTLAASDAHLDCLKYAHSQGVFLQEKVIRLAAQHPQGLDCLKYAHSVGLPLNSCLYFSAFDNNNVEMVQYLHEHGCYWDQYVLAGAVRAEATDCVKYLQENKCAEVETESESD